MPPQRHEPLSIGSPFLLQHEGSSNEIFHLFLNQLYISTANCAKIRNLKLPYPCIYCLISFTKLQSTNWFSGTSFVILSRSLVSCTSRLTPLSEMMPSSVNELIEVS